MSTDGGDGLAAKARRWHGYAGDVRRAAAHTRRASGVKWESEAAAAFRRRLHDVAADIDRCAGDVAGAADALTAYARAVESRTAGGTGPGGGS